jgi:hypothetical protein
MAAGAMNNAKAKPATVIFTGMSSSWKIVTAREFPGAPLKNRHRRAAISRRNCGLACALYGKTAPPHHASVTSLNGS